MLIKSGGFTIIESLRNYSISETSKRLSIPQRTVERMVKLFKSLGIIEKVGYGTWKVNDNYICKLYPKQPAKQGYHGIIKTAYPNKKSGGLFSDSFRTHDLQFRLRIKDLNRWNNVGRRKFLDSHHIKYENIKQGQKLFIDGFRIWLTNVSVLIWIPKSFFVDDPDDGYNYGVFEFLKIVSKLEKLLKVSFKIMGKYEFRPCRQHQALIKNALARQYNKDKKDLYVFDERGNWLLIDNSENLDECEVIGCRGVDGVESRDDSKIVQQFFNELKEVRLTPKMTMNIVSGLVKNQSMYAENISTHIKAVQDLSKGVNNLLEEVSNLSSVVKKFKR